MKKHLTYYQCLDAISLLEEIPVDGWPNSKTRGIGMINKNEAFSPIQERWQDKLQNITNGHIEGEIDHKENNKDLTDIERQFGVRLDNPEKVGKKLHKAQQEEVEVRVAVIGDGPEDFEEAREITEQLANAINNQRGENEPDVDSSDLSFFWPIKR